MLHRPIEITYLIDDKIIYDLLKKEDIAKKSIPNRGEVLAIFKEIATSQLSAVVIEKVYSSLNYENPGFRPKLVSGKTYVEAGEILFNLLETMQNELCSLGRKTWCTEFAAKCDSEYTKENSKWDVDWLILCDGKRFFKDLHARFEMKISPLKFKKLVVEKMEKEPSSGWVLVEKLISEALHS